MHLWDAILKRTSVRSFKQDPVPHSALEAMIEGARIGPSAANLQPLEYVVVDKPELREQVFGCLKWAAYTHPVGTPAKGFEPTAYVMICQRSSSVTPIGAAYDIGAAAQTIMLMASAEGIGSCWLKSINYPRLSKIIGLPKSIELDTVIALGYPAEHPKRVNLKPGGYNAEDMKYWRDEEDRHFVPKRALRSVLHWQSFGAQNF